MDIKRTVLWLVFSMSLLILWDNWMRHNGNPSMFFPNPASQSKQASAAAKTANNAATPSDAAAGAAAVGAAAAGGNVAVAGAPEAVAFKNQRITITTDLIKAEIDTLGGELKRLELLKHKDSHDAKKNVVLFDQTAQRTYLAQTGLLGGNFPNHKSGFTALPGVRTLADGNEVQLVLESEIAGVKLSKIYTFKKGSYLIDLKHTVSNNTTASITPSVYLQLLHDGTKPENGGIFQVIMSFTRRQYLPMQINFKNLILKKLKKVQTVMRPKLIMVSSP